jgi:signal transduction histidine kinase
MHQGWVRRPTDRLLTFGMFFQDYLSTNKNLKMYLNTLYGSNLPYNIPGSVKYRNALFIEPYIRVDIGFSALLLDNDKTKRRSHSPFRNFENIWATLEIFNIIDRANTITRGLLDFSSSRQLATRPEDLNGLLEATLLLVRHELFKCQITLSKEFGDDLPAVLVDKTQIQQVFVNVFMNAIHAMPDGGKLTVRTYLKQVKDTTFVEGSRSASHLWIGEKAVVAEVEDSGTGIAQEHLAKIFDPFFTTKPAGKGTGLGLPVSKKIIELHGGLLDIKNMAPRGVRVTIMLRAQQK